MSEKNIDDVVTILATGATLRPFTSSATIGSFISTATQDPYF